MGNKNTYLLDKYIAKAVRVGKDLVLQPKPSTISANLNPVIKEVWKASAKSAVFGGTVDGLLGAREAKRYYDNKLIDKKQAYVHVIKETGCGVSSSGLGAVATCIAERYIKDTGKPILLIGLGTAIGTRYVYRKIIPSSLPDIEDGENISDSNLDEGTCENHAPLLSWFKHFYGYKGRDDE